MSTREQALDALADIEHQASGGLEIDPALFRTVRAALSAPAEQEGWQPMQTAPKDGTSVLVHPGLWPGRSCSTASFNADKHAKKPRPFWDRDDSFGQVTRSRDAPPTHWMHLPDAPGAAAPRPAPAEPQPEESEFETRADGKTVRKDRWEWTVRRIVALLWGNRREFEVDEVVQAVRELVPAPFNEGDDEGLCRAVLLEHPAPQPAGGEPQPAVQLTEEDVRRIVRDELAKGGA